MATLGDLAGLLTKTVRENSGTIASTVNKVVQKVQTTPPKVTTPRPTPVAPKPVPIIGDSGKSDPASPVLRAPQATDYKPDFNKIIPTIVKATTGIKPETTRAAMQVATEVPTLIKNNAEKNKVIFDEYYNTQYLEDAKKFGGATGSLVQAKELFKKVSTADKEKIFSRVQTKNQEGYQKQTELQKKALEEQLSNPAGVGATQYFPNSQVRKYTRTPEQERGQLVREALIDIPGAVIKGFLSGRSFGITDVLAGPQAGRQATKFSENKPLQAAGNFLQGAASVVAGFAGGARTYGAIAPKIGQGIEKLPVIGAFAKNHPIFTSYVLQNLGEEMFEASVRKSTGQEYGTTDFAIGMLLGGAFQGTSDVIKHFNKNKVKVLANFEQGLKSMEETKGDFLTKKETENVIMNMPIGNNFYGRDLFREARMVGLTGGRKGRPGIDYPAPLPTKPVEVMAESMQKPLGQKAEADFIAEADQGFKDQARAAEQVLEQPIPTSTKLKAELGYDLEKSAQDYLERLKNKKKVNSKNTAEDFFRKIADSGYLKQFDTEGKELSQKLLTSDKKAVRWTGEKLEAGLAPFLKGATEEDMNIFRDLALGKATTTTNERAKKMFEAWDDIRTHISGMAQEFGLKVVGSDGEKKDFIPRKNYLPQVLKTDILDELLKTEEKQMKLARQMVINGKFKTIEEADAVLTKYISDKKSGKFGNLEFSRIEGLPPELYETDLKKIIPNYVEGAYKRLADAEQFGGSDEILNNLISSYGKKGGDTAQLRDVFEVMAGLRKYSDTMEDVSKKLRAFQYVTKLGLSAITNVGDVLKPIVKTGLLNTLKSTFETFTKEGADFNARSGATQKNIDVVAKEAGDMKFTSKFMKAIGFTWTEQRLRAISATAGKNYAKTLFEKLSKNPDNVFARRRLEAFGVDVDSALKRGNLTPDELADVGFESIKSMQPVGRQEIPYYWQSPTGRLLTQFKSFAYKQGKFIWNEIAMEAKKGNVAPLARFLVFGLLIGEELGDVKAYVRGKERDGVGLNEAIMSGDPGKYFSQDNWKRIVDGYLGVGGIGLASDFISNVGYNGVLGSPLLTFLAGPTFGEADSILGAIASDVGGVAKGEEFIVGKPDMGKGEKQPQVLKRLVGDIPVVGPMVRQQLFPSKETYRSRTPSLKDDILGLVGVEEPAKTSDGINFKKLDFSGGGKLKKLDF